MADQTDERGICRKYNVTRTDGSSGPGGKHERCAYFVLDLEHDPYAVPALKAYAEACRGTHPQLAIDIEASLNLPGAYGGTALLAAAIRAEEF
jgi:hypothetical protein